MQLINIGFGNTVMADRIIAVVNSGSSPARKLKELAKNGKKLVDVTEGRRTRSLLVMDSNHVVLSSIQPDTISQRLASLQLELHVSSVLKGKETK
ncbi:MAG TPA: DUF370 domain-containing protein [Desulfocapsa sulfexigens]|nr:DUF370 domain-containing protein [Desulfocapsa sulfexigens]